MKTKYYRLKGGKVFTFTNKPNTEAKEMQDSTSKDKGNKESTKTDKPIIRTENK